MEIFVSVLMLIVTFAFGTITIGALSLLCGRYIPKFGHIIIPVLFTIGYIVVVVWLLEDLVYLTFGELVFCGIIGGVEFGVKFLGALVLGAEGKKMRLKRING